MWAAQKMTADMGETCLKVVKQQEKLMRCTKTDTEAWKERQWKKKKEICL